MAISSQPSADEVIAEKMTGSHIARLIENSARSDRQAWIDGLVERAQVTILFIAVLILIGLICDWTIKAQQYQMTEKFVIAFLGFIGGFGIGGANERRKKKKSD